MSAYAVQLLFANNAQTTLAGSITNVATTANLATGSGVLFPSPTTGQGFVGTFTDLATGLLHEVVLVTARSGDTITMQRGQEGTTPQAWNANDLFANLNTKGTMETMVQAYQLQEQQTNYAVDTGTANAYVAGFLPAIAAAPPTGTPYNVKINNANTTASTLDAGWGAVAIQRRDGSALIGNELISGMIASFKWDGAHHQLQGIQPATNAAVTAGTDTQSAVTPAQLASSSFAPSGSFLWSGALATPAGYLLCDGSSQSRTTFATLFNAITLAAAVTITIASPGVITWNSHGLVAGDIVSLETTGSLPSGLATGTNYFVVAPTTNTFELAATAGGSAINTTGSQSGTQTARHNPYGCGNGTTTFTLPDGQNRYLFGGYGSTGRITSAGLGGGQPPVLGAPGGQQTETASVSGATSGNLSVGGTTAGLSVGGTLTGNVTSASQLAQAGTSSALLTAVGDTVTASGTLTGGGVSLSGTASGSLGVSGSTTSVSNLPPSLGANLFIKT